jgi:hypothetical protein
MTDSATYSVQTRAHDEKGLIAGPNNLGEVGLQLRARSLTDVPLYGTAWRERDRRLRLLARLPNMEPVVAAISIYQQKLQSTSWFLEGPQAIARAQHNLLHHADYGQGWEEFVGRTSYDWLTQDNGLFVEVIGAGDPAGPLTGPVLGIAHLDAGRCQRTGSLEYPVLYTDMNGKPHKLHTTRVLYQADMPDPDEKRLGIGYCALSRVVSVAQRLFNWGEMSTEFMDNFPAAGILVVKGMAKKLFDDQMKAYEAARQMSESEIYHGLIELFYQTAQTGQGVELVPFRQLWDNFSQRELYDVMIDLVAMGFDLDRQEIAPLSTSALGSGAQSTVLSQKSRGKGIATLLNLYERLINRVMPASVSFHFDFVDDQQSKVQAEIRQIKANLILSLYQSAGAKPQPTQQMDTVNMAKPAQETKAEGIISREEARYMAVKDGIIPRELYELDEPMRPDWQRFDDITVKARRRYGPTVVLDKAGKVALPTRKWGAPRGIAIA